MSLTEKSSFSCIHRAQTSPSHLQPYTTWFNALENNNAYLIHKTPVTSMFTYILKLCCQYFSQELKHKRVCLIIVVHWQFFFCNSFPNSFHFHLLQFIIPFLHTLLSDIKEKKTPLIECKIQEIRGHKGQVLVSTVWVCKKNSVVLSFKRTLFDSTFIRYVFVIQHFTKRNFSVAIIHKGVCPKVQSWAFYITFLKEKVPLLCTFHKWKMLSLSQTY